jgi:Tfp pilus assembly protein PilX
MRPEKGQATLLAVMVIAIIVILGTAGLTLATYSKRAATGSLDRTQALYAAEAGLEKALLLLKVDPLWEDSAGTTLGGDFKDAKGNKIARIDYVKVTTTESNWQKTVKTIVTQVSAGQVRKTLTAKVEITASPFISYAGLGVNIVPVDASAYLTLENGTQVHADLLYTGGTLTFAAGSGHHGSWRTIVGTADKPRTVRAVGKVEFDTTGHGGGHGDSGGSSDPVVYGYVYARQFTPSDPSQYISGGFQANWVPDPAIPAYPDIDLNTYRRAAKLMDVLNFPGGKHYLEGNQTITLSSMKGLYFIDGEVTLKGGNCDQRVTIVARDGIIIKGNITRNGGGALSLVTPRDIVVDNGSNNVAALFFTGGTLAVKSSAALTGGVNARWLAEETSSGGGRYSGYGQCCCGKSVGVLFEADTGLAGQMPAGFPVTVKVSSWKE